MEVLTFPLNLEITTELNRYPGMIPLECWWFLRPQSEIRVKGEAHDCLQDLPAINQAHIHLLILGQEGDGGLCFSLLHRWSPCPSSQSFVLVITRSSVLKWEISHTWAVKFKGWSQLNLLETWDRINVVLAPLRWEKTTEKSTNSAC